MRRRKCSRVSGTKQGYGLCRCWPLLLTRETVLPGFSVSYYEFHDEMHVEKSKLTTQEIRYYADKAAEETQRRKQEEARKGS